MAKKKIDFGKKLEEIDALQTEMIMSYTKAMQENRSKGIYSKQIVKCVDYIHANLQQELRLETIAEYLNMNPTYLSRLFKKEMNISISAYIKHERLKSAAYLLEYSNYSISEISEYLNFSSQSHFTSSFQELYGLTPKARCISVIEQHKLFSLSIDGLAISFKTSSVIVVKVCNS